MSNWRTDLENAPRDGTKIDLWTDHEESGPHRIPDAYWNGNNWQLGQFAEHEYKFKHKITHWRLVEPPSSHASLERTGDD